MCALINMSIAPVLFTDLTQHQYQMCALINMSIAPVLFSNVTQYLSLTVPKLMCAHINMSTVQVLFPDLTQHPSPTVANVCTHQHELAPVLFPESESDWLSWGNGRFFRQAKGQKLVASSESVSDTTWMRGLGFQVYTPLIPG